MRFLDEEEIIPICDIIAEKILEQEAVAGNRGSIVALDGPSGVGKTTVCRKVAERLQKETRKVFMFPLDDFLVPRDKSEALKQYILGEALSPEEEHLLTDRDRRLIKPEQVCTHERELFWRTREIASILRRIRKWIDEESPEPFVFIAEHAWDRDTGTSGSKTYRIQPRSLILLEGKLSVWTSIQQAAQYDITFRLVDDPQMILERYRSRKHELTPGDIEEKNREADRAMRFYSLLMGPSWDSYNLLTKDHIDWFVHRGLGTLYDSYSVDS